MYSDTHFHFHMLEESLQPRVLREMAVRDCFFGLDIGTHCDDLILRQDGIDKAIEKCAGIVSDDGAARETGIVSDERFNKSAEDLSNENLSGETLKSKIKSFIRFSAGIWPALEAIRDRKNQIEILEKMIRGAGIASDDGTESEVFIDVASEKVRKLISLKHYNVVRLALDRIIIHNAIFHTTPLVVTGFGRNQNEEFVIMVEQPYIRGRGVSEQERLDFMTKLGFEEAGEDYGMHLNYKTPTIYIGDLNEFNVLKGESGIHVVDADCRLNVRTLGCGGSYYL